MRKAGIKRNKGVDRQRIERQMDKETKRQEEK
jgi:hypothetical protein